MDDLDLMKEATWTDFIVRYREQKFNVQEMLIAFRFQKRMRNVIPIIGLIFALGGTVTMIGGCVFRLFKITDGLNVAVLASGSVIFGIALIVDSFKFVSKNDLNYEILQLLGALKIARNRADLEGDEFFGKGEEIERMKKELDELARIVNM